MRVALATFFLAYVVIFLFPFFFFFWMGSKLIVSLNRDFIHRKNIREEAANHG